MKLFFATIHIHIQSSDKNMGASTKYFSNFHCNVRKYNKNENKLGVSRTDCHAVVILCIKLHMVTYVRKNEYINPLITNTYIRKHI